MKFSTSRPVFHGWWICDGEDVWMRSAERTFLFYSRAPFQIWRSSSAISVALARRRAHSEISNFATTSFSRSRQTHSVLYSYTSSWVAFTATERAYQPQPFHTLVLLLHGSRPLLSRLWTKSANLQRRAQLRLKSVSFLETLTVLPKSR